MPLYEHKGDGEGGGERRRTVAGSLEDERLSASESGWQAVDESKTDDRAAQSGSGSTSSSSSSKRRPRGPETSSSSADSETEASS